MREDRTAIRRPRPRRARPHSRRSAARASGRNCARAVECNPSAATSRSPSAREPSSKTATTPSAAGSIRRERLAAGIAGVRQRLPQRPPDPRPGAGDGAHRQFVDDVAVGGRGRCGRRTADARSRRRRQARCGASRRTAPRACRCRCRDRRGRPRRARTRATSQPARRSRWAANRPPTEPPITNARGLRQASAPLRRDASMMTIRMVARKRFKAAAGVSSDASRARFDSASCSMAPGFCAASHRATASARSDGLRERRCRLHLIHIIVRDSQSFPAFSKNESLRLQGFRPTLRAP